MHALARLERVESRNRRGSPRRQLSLGAVVPETGDEVMILDLSATGMLIETKADLATFEQLQLELPEVGPTVATVIWNSGDYYGCEFHQPLPTSAVSAALLRSPFDQTGESSAATAEEADEAELADDRFPLGLRLRVICGSALLLWALILWVFGIV